jgi:short-subunit dehydrogenase
MSAHVNMCTNDIVNSREFAKLGYRVALIARNADHLNKLAEDIKGSGGEVSAYRDYVARTY